MDDEARTAAISAQLGCDFEHGFGLVRRSVSSEEDGSCRWFELLKRASEVEGQAGIDLHDCTDLGVRFVSRGRQAQC